MVLVWIPERDTLFGLRVFVCTSPILQTRNSHRKIRIHVCMYVHIQDAVSSHKTHHVINSAIIWFTSEKDTH